MFEVSKLLFEILSKSPVFENVVQKRIFPVVAGEGVQYPFSVYSMRDENPETKDSESYRIALHTFFSPNKIAEAMLFSDNSKKVIDEYFIYQGGGIDFIEKDQSIVVSVYFEIIM